MPFCILQAHVLETEQAGSDVYGIGRGQESSIQNVDLHLHLCLDFPFQIELGEGAEQTHVAMHASVDIAEYIFYKGLQEGERGTSGLDMEVESLHLGRYVADDPCGAGTVAADVGIEANAPQLFIP